MTDAEQLKQVGRYQLVKLLGRGIHGAVFLATDPQLQRPVALKTVSVRQQSSEATIALLAEARTTSQVQHPNIVTLYDVLEQDGQVYLVFEYVEGETLAARLAGSKRLDKAQALDIALQVLDGLAFAHSKGVIHCGIKPANIMLDKQEVARVMDFGIARQPSKAEAVGVDVRSTSSALIDVGQGKAADVFAMGLVLYEMLTGQSVFHQGNQASSQALQVPSTLNPDLDEALDNIVMRALQKDPEERFLSAEQMYSALKQYSTSPGGDEEVEAKQSTLDFLLRRIRLKSDFPALSQAIMAINRLNNADTESLHSLTDIILKDFSLTNKLLRLANSASFGQYGGSISTISSAVIILGFEAVRNLAITLILFEHLQNKSQAVQLRDEVIRTFLNGLMARQIEKKLGTRSPEESFIAAMFHNLGRLLATFYLYEEALEIRRRVQANAMSEELAEVAVLGIGYADLGMGIARSWNFPDKLVDSMLPPSPERVRAPQGKVERMRVVAGLSNALTRIATVAPAVEKPKLLAGLSKRFFPAFAFTEGDLSLVVDDAVKEFIQESALFGINSAQSEALRNARIWAGVSGSAGKEPSDPLEQKIQETQSASDQVGIGLGQDAASVLTTGVQDITNLLVSEYNLNELLRAILEIMYRGLGFDRVLLCMRDLKSQTLPARIGFGPSISSLIKRFIVPIARSQDVFQVALDKQADIFLSDVNAANIRERIPAWYRETVAAETFILLPVVIDKKVIGLFYGDKSAAGTLKIDPKELSLLKTLRNQAVLAIRQKQMG